VYSRKTSLHSGKSPTYSAKEQRTYSAYLRHTPGAPQTRQARNLKKAPCMYFRFFFRKKQNSALEPSYSRKHHVCIFEVCIFLVRALMRYLVLVFFPRKYIHGAFFLNTYILRIHTFWNMRALMRYLVFFFEKN